jgi:hypothetical protein
LGGTGGAPGVHEPIDECAGDLVEANPIPLDMYVMLDVSASMLQPTDSDPDTTKWAAVSSALVDFVNDPDSAGLGVGLQVFPVPHEQAPKQCTTSAQCGAFGPCFAKVCWPPATDFLDQCESSADCPLISTDGCVRFGVCANDRDYVCPTVGDTCGREVLNDPTSRDLGDCVANVPTCMNTADCKSDTYATPAAPIAELPGGSAALVGVIQAAQPDGNTPTEPALTGAIKAASDWATAHPDHQVITVLATDGSPTQHAGAGNALACVPVEVDADIIRVFQVAAAGRAATPSISTFVIGVMGPQDVASPIILDSIAESGGTGQAFIVDTAGNVNAQFRSALNEIRAGRLSCELLVPKPAAGKTLDFHEVNVVFDDGTGPKDLDYYADETQCAGKPGWHYDVDPDAGGTPTRIVACPSTCGAFSKVAQGSVSIKLGCTTRVPLK